MNLAGYPVSGRYPTARYPAEYPASETGYPAGYGYKKRQDI